MGINNINNLEKKEEIKSSNSNFNILLNWRVIKQEVPFSYLNASSKTSTFSSHLYFLVTNYGKTSFINLAISNNLNKCYNNKTIVKVKTTKFLGIQNHKNANCRTHTVHILK